LLAGSVLFVNKEEGWFGLFGTTGRICRDLSLSPVGQQIMTACAFSWADGIKQAASVSTVAREKNNAAFIYLIGAWQQPPLPLLPLHCTHTRPHFLTHGALCTHTRLYATTRTAHHHAPRTTACTRTATLPATHAHTAALHAYRAHHTPHCRRHHTPHARTHTPALRGSTHQDSSNRRGYARGIAKQQQRNANMKKNSRTLLG